MKIISFFIIALFPFILSAQQYKSIMQEQSEYYQKQGISAKEYYKINKPAKVNKEKQAQTCNLNKIVFGWHPYWSNGLESNYNWNLISDFCYFSYELNASTGNANTTHDFENTASVTEALNHNVNVHLCVTLFSNHSTFLESSTARQTLIDNLINILSNRGAIGVNIDFEGIPSSQRDNFTDFMIQLSNAMHQNIPNSKVSFDLYAVDWNDVYDVATMAPYVDYFIIMGYDYYYSGSSQAGPNSPLYSMTSSYNYNLSKTITYYLHKGAPADKLVMGIPYYGRDWPVESNIIPANTTASGSAKFYRTIKDNADGYYSNPLWEANSFTTYYAYTTGGDWHQCFTDDETTLAYKYDLFNRRGLAGIGIWALGYDDGYTQLWDLINDKLTDCATTPCTDTIYDMGGPAQNYYDNEDYTYTIAPTGASNLSLNFLQFDIEADYDSLWLYDGTSTNSPIIGVWTGTNSPGNIASTSNAITLRFKSDGATTKPGFKSVWQCSVDNIPPTTSISCDNWQNSDFQVQFTDNDNIGLLYKFYQVVEYTGQKHTANKLKGYFFDDFTDALNWTNLEGTWSINNNEYNQSDESNTNTNTYTSFLQTSSNVYLYKWQMKISGTGTNRRAGIYFFSTDATQSQRENAYMVYFRVDQDECQIYKADNNNLTLKTNDNCTVDADVWYDYTVLYDALTGIIKVYQNNILVSQWQDSSPIQNAYYISFRTGECNVSYKNFSVYKSRDAYANVNVGLGSQDDVQYQNINENTPACTIKSVVCDQSYNLSDIATKNVNIDWTAPSNIPYVNDGDSTDIDEIFDYLNMSANWGASSDNNSGIKQYWYAIGTTPNTDDVLTWTNTGNNNTSFFVTPANIESNTTYYTTIKSENNAGLFSDEICSDGVIIRDTSLDVSKLKSNDVIIYPNPAGTFIYLKNIKTDVKISIYTINGNLVKQYVSSQTDLKINIEELKAGVYFVKINDKNYKLIISK